MTPKITDKALSGTGLIVLSTALACALSDASESPSGGGVKNMVINPQSYPTVGGNRAVLFNTTGAADLWITAVDGTTWTDQPYECYDEKTEVLTDKGWKLFNNLNDERVLTQL